MMAGPLWATSWSGPILSGTRQPRLARVKQHHDPAASTLMDQRELYENGITQIVSI